MLNVDPTKNPNETSFIIAIINKTPGWAIGAFGTLLTLAIVLKIIGIDFAQPINSITESYTQAIIRQAEGMEEFDSAVRTMQAIIEEQRKSLNDLEKNIQSLFSQQAAINEQTRESLDDLNNIILVLSDRMDRLEGRIEKIEHTHPE